MRNRRLHLVPLAFACAVLCLGVWGCRTQRALQSDADYMEEMEEPRPELLFVMGTVVHDSLTDECRMTVSDVSHVYGEAKLEMASEVEGDQSFSYDQLSAAGRKLESRTREYPLVQTLEFSYEDGRLESRTVVRDSAQFFVRIQLNLQAKSITFNYKKKPIANIKLSNYKIK